MTVEQYKATILDLAGLRSELVAAGWSDETAEGITGNSISYYLQALLQIEGVTAVVVETEE